MFSGQQDQLQQCMRHASASPVEIMPDLRTDNVTEIPDRCIRIQYRRIPLIIHHKFDLIVDAPHDQCCQCDQHQADPPDCFFLLFLHISAPFLLWQRTAAYN